MQVGDSFIGLETVHKSLTSIIVLVYISAAYSNVQLPTLIETFFWEASSANLQGWNISPLLVDIEFLMTKKLGMKHMIWWRL